MEEVLQQLEKKVRSIVQPNDQEWQAFTQKWKPFSFDKNHRVTDLGQVEPYFYFISEGVIRGYFIKSGEEFNIGFSYHGEYSGVYDSFMLQKPSQYALETLTETFGIRIKYRDLMPLFDQYKVFERWGRLFNQSVLVGFGIFIQSILADSAEERFNRLMQQSPHIFQLVPQKHLASYLGMSAETFSRMRKKTM
ncbi:cAMP-binding domain-containing regulatory protein [Roseivirga seohaensis subsp. aquiponti]|uniref:cAMP-binding domain-containing regulatory protein n=1 Tax=Roseivirga seohaensis subsp. aquiponti TaxID=1566026 RepID=A0A0L8ANQ2_9BACT|nr:Crp/Fnr family transcriptional regulator [Roseivirga seohaensis]KOF03802.1 cAMP-binding domain-containing regulatory protein [Roseivirga seohaensis subsp. aquiponti]